MSGARKLPKKAINLITALVALAVVAGAVLFLVLSGAPQKTVTARFSSAVGVYSGTPVELLGIGIGKVTSVHPNGATVNVEMAYDSKYRLPKNAIAVVVANSLVSDRYLQLAPAYPGTGPTLADGAVIPPSRTAAPAELDDIYSALNKLSISLGPKGANKNGALRQLVNVGAANLQGNGAALGTSISKLSAAAHTLAAGRGDLFGTVKNLQAFTKALSDSDVQVRHFNQQLAAVAGALADERTDLGAALHNLADAINQVAGFVKTNAGRTTSDISELKTLTDVLVHQHGSLNETLAVAPVALANIVHAYQPDLGVIATRSNLASLIDPATLCALLDPALIPGVPASATSPLGPVSAPIRKTCTAVLGKIPLSNLLSQLGLPGTLNGGALGGAINGLVGGLTGPGLGGIITGGG